MFPRLLITTVMEKPILQCGVHQTVRGMSFLALPARNICGNGARPEMFQCQRITTARAKPTSRFGGPQMDFGILCRPLVQLHRIPSNGVCPRVLHGRQVQSRQYWIRSLRCVAATPMAMGNSISRSWHPTTGEWECHSECHPGDQPAKQWGLPDDVPAGGDSDGYGSSDFAVWRPSMVFGTLRRATETPPYLQTMGPGG